MKMIKAPAEFRAGTAILEFIKLLEEETKDYPQTRVGLDLSEVVYMDSHSFRVVFNFLSKLPVVIPPKSQHIIDMYNTWLDGKKGLRKNYE
jgi:hypothetical protein